MDPVAHTFTGAALAAAGLRRATPLAAAALVLGANAPDVDVVAYFAGDYAAIAFRRGWTHGVLALAVWPFVLAGLLLAWDRYVRRRRDPAAAPARAGPLLALSALAVITHPTLDWLNNYGLRWLMPFDGRWFYGDALFIIDPWVYLLLGGALFIGYSRSRRALVAWLAFWALASVLVLGNPTLVPPLARVLWVAGVALIMLWRWRASVRPTTNGERVARGALVLGAVYVATLVAASAAARQAVRTELASRGIVGVESVMVAPSAANPFGGDVVVVTRAAYLVGRWRWLGETRLSLADEAVARPSGAAFEAAARTTGARRFLVWSRFPVASVEPADAGGVTVRFFDARYLDGARLGGPSVRLDAELRPVEESR